MASDSWPPGVTQLIRISHVLHLLQYLQAEASESTVLEVSMCGLHNMIHLVPILALFTQTIDTVRIKLHSLSHIYLFIQIRGIQQKFVQIYTGGQNI